MTIEQSISIKASAAKVYDALTSADQFSKVTGAPTEIASEEGGAFLMFGGEINGRHLELIPGQRIVQAWRVTNMWPAGVYSVVRFDLAESDGETTLTLTHTGYPDGDTEHLEPGWHKMYWDPLKAYLE
jgi:activator of HSP90 ATPase